MAKDSETHPAKYPIRVLFRDDNLVIVDKPPGILTHPNRYDRSTPSIVNSLSGSMHSRVFPVHRLDRETSGAMVFSLDRETASALGRDFSDSRVEKLYLALSYGQMGEEADVNVPVRQGGNGRKLPARSIIRGLVNFTLDDMPLCLLAVTLITGRSHQARVHCETIAKPIIGDRQHGWKKINEQFMSIPSVREILAEEGLEGDPGLFLRSSHLGFKHPVSGEAVDVWGGLPALWRRFLPDPGTWTGSSVIPAEDFYGESRVRIGGVDRTISPGNP